MDPKQRAAKEAVKLIDGKTTVGLGAGSTIAYLVEFLSAQIKNGQEVKFVTSSLSTLQLLLKNHFDVRPIGYIDHLDIYFDGCDQVDHALNALKSGGGIHTHEKMLATMARDFVLLGDEKKYVEQFDLNVPLVIEILPEAARVVPGHLIRYFPGASIITRMGINKDGPVITSNGNYLLDVRFDEWPALSTINQACKTITGVLETSLFYQLASKAIIAKAESVEIYISENRSTETYRYH